MFQQALFFPLPVPLFLRGPFIVFLLALGQTNFNLGLAAYPVHGQWHEGVAFAFHRTNKLVQFLFMQQQLAGAGGVWCVMGGDRGQGRDEGAQQPGFTVFNDDVTVPDLHFTGAQRDGVIRCLWFFLRHARIIGIGGKLSRGRGIGPVNSA
jgi:hypothetical protein